MTQCFTHCERTDETNQRGGGGLWFVTCSGNRPNEATRLIWFWRAKKRPEQAVCAPESNRGSNSALHSHFGLLVSKVTAYKTVPGISKLIDANCRRQQRAILCMFTEISEHRQWKMLSSFHSSTHRRIIYWFM